MLIKLNAMYFNTKISSDILYTLEPAIKPKLDKTTNCVSKNRSLFGVEYPSARFFDFYYRLKFVGENAAIEGVLVLKIFNDCVAVAYEQFSNTLPN